MFKMLSPGEVARIANGVYFIRSNSRDISGFFSAQIRKEFDISDDSRFEGVSGGSFLTSRTGFGVIARGKDVFEGDVLIALRGTDITYDIITDIHAGNLYPSASGKMVHSGFNKVFLSFERQLEQFFTQFSPRRVHCVGHSLGGAVATLTAEWLASKGIGEPMLYTFGSPRVGSANFARYLTGKIKEKNIFRVHHKSDPITMVPLWPFTHVPLPGSDCFIDTPGSFSPSMHKMENYIRSVDNKSWEALKRNKEITVSDKIIEAWLKETNPLKIEYYNILLVQQALLYIIKKILYLTGISVQALLVAGVSNFLDVLAYVLDIAGKKSIEVAGYIQHFIRRILSAIGVVVDTTKNLTASFIRWALFKFTEAIMHLARMALHVSNRRVF